MYRMKMYGMNATKWIFAIARCAGALVLAGAAMAVAAATTPAAPVAAVAPIAPSSSRVETVQFAKGATTVAISGELKGDQYVDYRVRGGANQTLAVTLKASNLQNYFNILPPGSSGTAMFIGSTSGNQFKRILPTDGEFVVRVYLMRAAARRNEASNYTLNIALEGKPLPPNSAAKDAVIRGTAFHASANTPCAKPSNPQVRQCDVYVIRRGYDGTATVEVQWPDGSKRSILFVKLQPVATDSLDTMTYTRSGEVTAVSVGKDERADIHDVLLTGG